MRYRCNGCGYVEDAEKRPTACPKCGDNDADERNSVNSAPAFSPATGAPKQPAKTGRKRGN